MGRSTGRPVTGFGRNFKPLGAVEASLRQTLLMLWV